MHYAVIASAAIAAVIISAIYYIALAKQRAALSPAAREKGKPQPAVLGLEVVRTAVLTWVMAALLQRLPDTGVPSTLRVCGLLWLGFPVVLLAGSVIYEKTPWKLAALHAGDWLIKLMLIGSILAVWK